VNFTIHKFRKPKQNKTPARIWKVPKKKNVIELQINNATMKSGENNLSFGN
jgi:hypothetical protein